MNLTLKVLYLFSELPEMECLKCAKVWCSADDLMTYQKSVNEIHLIIKPERDRSKLTNLTLVPEGKDTRVTCKNCRHVAGKEVPVGPDSCRVLSFGLDKVSMERFFAWIVSVLVRHVYWFLLKSLFLRYISSVYG